MKGPGLGFRNTKVGQGKESATAPSPLEAGAAPTCRQGSTQAASAKPGLGRGQEEGPDTAGSSTGQGLQACPRPLGCKA